MLENDVKKVLITEEQLKEKIQELADRINEDYKDKNLLFIVILRGAFMFASDLYKRIKVLSDVDFMAVSSYGSGTESTGQIKILKDLSNPIDGKDIIIVEDILDTGITLDSLVKMLEVRNPASIEICTCISKPSRRMVDVEAKYVGFEVENEFIVGYGLDYNEKYRNLPYIGVLKEEVYSR